MKACIIRKVPYLLRGTSRIVWGIVLCEREGLSLLFVQSPDNIRPNVIVIATEHEADKIFVDVNVNNFPLEKDDVLDIGNKMRALGKSFIKADFRRLFDSEDD
jgi:hypothetical protein